LFPAPIFFFLAICCASVDNIVIESTESSIEFELGIEAIYRVMEVEQENHSQLSNNRAEVQDPSKSFSKKCSHAVKKQRAKFYILRRCIAILVCWHDNGEEA
ncbi:hypothetical protein Ancab_031869, partial [Ancistrocladus abbreviatus]